MKEDITHSLQDSVVWVLGAIGLSLTVSQFVGGLCLALLGAFIARGHSGKGADKRPILLTSLTALAVAIFAVAMVEQVGWEIAPGIVMFLAGFSSRFVVSIGLRLLGKAEIESDQLPKRLLDYFLPPKGRS